MNRESTNKRHTAYLPIIAAIAALGSYPTLAQVPVDEDGLPVQAIGAESSNQGGTEYQEFDIEEVEHLTTAELLELIGPVALYPDDLLAIVLPASTYPLEIVQAARFLEQLKSDGSLKPDEDWDESVTALLNYPEVIVMLNDDIDWTWKLGEAVVRQQQDVIAAVEDFRDRAYAAGNLKTDDRQKVSRDEGVIEIVPIDEEIIYVPYYEPERVLVTQVQPVYHYYPRAYPVYYYPYPYGHSFGSGYFWGVTTAFRIGWATDYLHVHHHSYWGHPYYGRSYFGNYYRRPSINVYNNYYVNNGARRSVNRHRDGDYWRPRTYGGARPGHYDARTRSYRANDVKRTANARSNRDRNSYTNARTVSASSAHRTTSQNRGDRNEIRFRSRDGASTNSRYDATRQRTTTSRTSTAPTRNGSSSVTRRANERDTIAFRSREQARDGATQRQVANRSTATMTRAVAAPSSRARQSSGNENRNRATTATARSNPRATSAHQVQRQRPSNSERKASPTPATAARQANRRSDSTPNRSQSSQRTTRGDATRSNSRESSRRRERH